MVDFVLVFGIVVGISVDVAFSTLVVVNVEGPTDVAPDGESDDTEAFRGASAVLPHALIDNAATTTTAADLTAITCVTVDHRLR